MGKNIIKTVAPNIRCKNGESYSFRYNYNDKNGKKVNVERFGFNSVEEAESARQVFAEEVKRLNDITKELTLEEIFNIFVEKRKDIFEDSTLKRYKSIYKNHLKANFGKQQINKININDISDYLFSLFKTKSHKYICSIYKIIKAIFDFAEDRNYLTTNNIKKVKLPPDKDIEKEKIYSKEELETLDNRFKTTTLYTSYMLGRYLGVRVGECFGLMWSDIDFNKKTISITKQMAFQKGEWVLKNTKTKAAVRTIDIPDKLFNYLLELKETQEKQKELLGARYKYVRIVKYKEKNIKEKTIKRPDFINLKSNGGWYNTDSVKILSRIAKSELNIDYKSHNLRHTHASELVAFVEPVCLKNRLGHSKIETTMRYYVHETEPMKDTLNKALSNL